MNRWKKWKGGECPVKDNQLVKVRFRDNEKHQGKAEHFCWKHKIDDADADIVAYQIL